MKSFPDSTVSILIPDGEWEVLTNHVKNCFSEIKKIELYVMSSKKYLPSRYSRFVRRYTYVPPSTNELDWIKAINKLVERYPIDIILPVYHEGIERLIIHKDKLTRPDKLVILPELNSFRLAGNKRMLAAHMAENSIPHPKSYPLVKGQPITPNEKAFPLLAKPESDAEGGRGIQLIESRESLQAYFDDAKQGTGVLFQEYIEGYDIDCSVLCSKGDIKAYTIQKGILAGKSRYAPPSGIVFEEAPQLLESIQKLMKSLDWSGVAHVDCRYDVNRGDYKVLEINTRYWTSLDGSLQAGINFPWLHVRLSRGEELKSSPFDKIEFLSLKGLAKRIAQNPFIIGSVRYLWNNTSVKYAIKDPLPVFVRLLMRVYNLSIRFKNKIRRGS